MKSLVRVTGFTAVHLKYSLSMLGGTIRMLVFGERWSTRPISLEIGLHFLFLKDEQVEESVQSNGWYFQLKLAGGKPRLVVQFNSSFSSLTTLGVSHPVLLRFTNTGSTTKQRKKGFSSVQHSICRHNQKTTTITSETQPF